MKRTIAAALAALLLVLAGCGAKGGSGQPLSPAPTGSPTAEATSVQPGESETQPVPEDDHFHAGSVEELVEAIRPHAKIMIEPGRYDLTDFLSGFPNVRDRDTWNDEHEYVQIIDTFDGLELVVKNVTELTVEGGSDDPADTELVIEPRYAAVLNFSGCTGIELGRLTMGHTDTGDRSGDVLYFDHTKSIICVLSISMVAEYTASAAMISAETCM